MLAEVVMGGQDLLNVLLAKSQQLHTLAETATCTTSLHPTFVGHLIGKRSKFQSDFKDV